MRIFTYLSVVLSLVLAATSEPHAVSSAARRHHTGKFGNATAVQRLEKRFDNARFSFYDAGLGSCGKTNTASDFIVALNSAQYDSGSYCFQMITISFGGKTTQAQITDRCPGCPYAGLDFSRGLFDFFSSEDAGIIYGEWTFGSGDPSPSPKPKTTPTSTREASSSTSTPQATSTKTTPSPSPTTSSSSTSSSSSSSSTSSAAPSVAASSSSSSSSITYTSTTPNAAVETAGPISNSEAGGNLNQLNLALIGMGGMVASGSKVVN